MFVCCFCGAVFVVGFGCGCGLRCLWMVRKSSGLVQVQAQEFAQEFAQALTLTSYRLKYCVCLKHCVVIFLCDSLCLIKITYSILVQVMVRDNPTHTSAFTHKQRAIKIITAQNDTAAAMENEMASETAAFRSVGAQFVRFAR